METNEKFVDMSADLVTAINSDNSLTCVEALNLLLHTMMTDAGYMVKCDHKTEGKQVSSI